LTCRRKPLGFHPSANPVIMFKQFKEWLLSRGVDPESAEELSALLNRVFNQAVAVELGWIDGPCDPPEVAEKAREILIRLGVEGVPQSPGWSFASECIRTCRFGYEPLDKELSEWRSILVGLKAEPNSRSVVDLGNVKIVLDRYSFHIEKEDEQRKSGEKEVKKTRGLLSKLKKLFQAEEEVVI